MKCPKCGYDHNSDEALYCGLCYELLKKAAKPAQPEAAPTEPAKTEINPYLTIALIMGIMSGAGVYFYEASSADGALTKAAQAEDARLQEKEASAYKLLAAYDQGRGELLGELAKSGLDPDGFGIQGQYTKRLFKLEEDYTNGLSAAQLNCPGGAQGAGSPNFSKWCEAFTAKETASMEDFNKKYQEFIRRVGAR